MREDEVRALEALERAWGLRETPSVVCPGCGVESHHPKDIEYRYCARCHRFHDDVVWATDDGAAPPNFLMIEKTEHEEFGILESPSWPKWLRENLFALDTPWLTALVCLVASLATAAVLVIALGR